MTEPRSAGSKAGRFALCVLLRESWSLGTEKTPPEVWTSVSPGRSSGQVPFHITLGPPDGRPEPEVWPRLSVVRMGPSPWPCRGRFPGLSPSRWKVWGHTGLPGHVASSTSPRSFRSLSFRVCTMDAMKAWLRA